MASQVDVPKRYRYTGKERDEENDLYYHGARYYAPWLGRWTAADPAGIKDGTDVYGYCAGNPIVMKDPHGTQAKPGGQNSTPDKDDKDKDADKKSEKPADQAADAFLAEYAAMSARALAEVVEINQKAIAQVIQDLKDLDALDPSRKNAEHIAAKAAESTLYNLEKIAADRNALRLQFVTPDAVTLGIDLQSGLSAIGMATGSPLYVLEIRGDKHEVVVGSGDDLF